MPTSAHQIDRASPEIDRPTQALCRSREWKPLRDENHVARGLSTQTTQLQRQDIMTTPSNKTALKAEELQIIAGLEKNAATLTNLIVQGKQVSVTQAIATLQARVNAITAAQSAKVAWTDAVQQQDQQLTSTNAFVESLVTVIRGMFAGAPSALADFGQVPRKVTVLTTAEKQEAAVKAAATRKARHTMGAKQKRRSRGRPRPWQRRLRPTL